MIYGIRSHYLHFYWCGYNNGFKKARMGQVLSSPHDLHVVCWLDVCNVSIVNRLWGSHFMSQFCACSLGDRKTIGSISCIIIIVRGCLACAQCLNLWVLFCGVWQWVGWGFVGQGSVGGCGRQCGYSSFGGMAEIYVGGVMEFGWLGRAVLEGIPFFLLGGWGWGLCVWWHWSRGWVWLLLDGAGQCGCAL